MGVAFTPGYAGRFLSWDRPASFPLPTRTHRAILVSAKKKDPFTAR
jgi:hypothetical protein